MSERTKFLGVGSTILQLTRDPTNFYMGRTLWFGVIVIYASVVYIVQFSWIRMQQDFQCHQDISEACVAECFESHFTVPFLGIWYLVGFTFSSIFFVMEFIVYHIIHKQTNLLKRKYLEEEAKRDRGGRKGEREEGDRESQEEGDGEEAAAEEREEDKEREDEEEEDREEGKEREDKHRVAVDQSKEDKVYDLSHEKPLLILYLVYFLIQMGIQAGFLVVLFHHQRPLIQPYITCSTRLCPGPHTCVILGTQEKDMTITILATFAGATMLFCTFFFLYTIHAYILTGRALSARHKRYAKC
ncbi:uncharacterized protein RHO17_002838 [Thomomys bottae]